jgi:hypothetical protein
MAIRHEYGKLYVELPLRILARNVIMTDRTLGQKDIAQHDGTHEPFEDLAHKANCKVVDGNTVANQSQTQVGDTTADTSIMNSGSFSSGADDAITIGIHPNDFTSVATISNHVVDGDKMNFVDHGSETASDLVALIREAVSETPPSLLSDMLPTVSTPEAVSAPHFRSAAASAPATIAAFPLVDSATPAPAKYPDRAPSTFEHGESAMKTSGLYGTRAREFGGVLLRFLNSMLTSTKTVKPTNRGKRKMMTPTFWSGRPMEFARYERPHGRGGFGADSEAEKRRHFPDK